MIFDSSCADNFSPPVARRSFLDLTPRPRGTLSIFRGLHDRHAAELAESGYLTAAFALEPAATATSIRGDTVTDGPFVDAMEVIAGFYVIDAPDLDEALRPAGRNPAVAQGGAVEVRPVAGGFVRQPGHG